MNKVIKIDQAEWEEKYKPLKDSGGSNIDCDVRLGDCTQEDFTKAKQENRVWTLLDCDGDEMVITNGFHFVNRMAHYITEVPFKQNEIIEVEY